METIVVTGGAGFIGSNFVRHALARTDARVVVLDKLTYAGNLESLADVASHPRYAFVQADIADREAVRDAAPRAPPRRGRQLRGRDPRRPLDRRPGRLRAHERAGTFELLEAARLHLRDEPVRRLPLPARLDRRGLRHPRPDRGLLGDDALRAQLALRRVEGGGRPPRARVPRDLRPARPAHQLLEQLRPLPVPREAHPAHDPERGRGQAPADLRRRRERARLALRRGPLRGDPARAAQGRRPARSTTSAAATSGRTCRWWTRCARRSKRSCPPRRTPPSRRAGSPPTPSSRRS